MGFYYGSSQPPPPDDKPAGFKETLQIIWAVFSLLALPLGVLLGGVLYLFFLFYLFSLHPLAGLGGILLIVAAVAARGIWEWKHPPELK